MRQSIFLAFLSIIPILISLIIYFILFIIWDDKPNAKDIILGVLLGTTGSIWANQIMNWTNCRCVRELQLFKLGREKNNDNKI